MTVAGELITHASDRAGDVYRHDVQATVGLNGFSAPVPLYKIDDIGGVLYTASGSHGCSVKPGPKPHLIKAAVPVPAAPLSSAPPAPAPAPAPATAPAPAAPPPAPTSCFPLSNEGTCYEPGEYCRESDHGASGVAGDGEKIVCEDNDGWRWEPA